MNFRRIKQVCEYGWKDAVVLSQEEGVNRGKWGLFLDILYCFFTYNVWSNQYKKEKLYLLSGDLVESYKKPSIYEWIDVIPKTESGKKQRLNLTKVF